MSRRATLRSKWWKMRISMIRRCFSCGAQLISRYVKEEGRRRRVCVSCTTITYVNPHIVVGCIPVLPDGRIILLKRGIIPALGKWSFPAGYMELGEAVQDAAARETREEILTKVRVGDLVGIYSYRDAATVMVVYEGRVLKGEKPRPGAETSDVQFFKKSEIPWRDLAFRSVQDALKDYYHA